MRLPHQIMAESAGDRSNNTLSLKIVVILQLHFDNLARLIMVVKDYITYNQVCGHLPLDKDLC